VPLQKILFKPGIVRENTRYTTEGGWYESDKVRFRQGTPEKIGGWTRFNSSTFLGICRSIWNWVTLGGANLLGIGTNLKFYIEQGGLFHDITPIRLHRTGGTALTDPFTATAGSSVITVADALNGSVTGDFVTFSGATGLGGDITASVLNQEHQLTVVTTGTYTIDVGVLATAGDTGHGGTVDAEYQLNVGPAIEVPLVGWGAGGWGLGTWGVGVAATSPLRLWNQYNFGENLIFGPRGGGVYWWVAASGTSARGVDLASIGDSDTPIFQNYIVVSDTSRFVIVMGTTDYGSGTIDPMLIRWSEQENPLVWTPAITNQAGSVRLSHGSEIVTAIQTRQEIVTFTDQAVYSLQYLGPPAVWGSQLLGDNISIVSPNAASLASGAVFWMGIDKFYMYDGRIQTLNCDIRRYIFSDFNKDQAQQIFAGTNEGFNEVWWFYCSANSTAVDRYAVYNYLEKIWYYGTMARTAWLDSGLLPYPIAATYINNIVNHEDGVDDNATDTTAPIDAYISSSEFDIGDGHNFGFVWRMLPDLTFDGSSDSPTGDPAQLTMTLYGLQNSGSGAISSAAAGVLKGSSYVITEEFTGQVYTRIRARQMILKVESNQIGTAWQIGAPRLDVRPDGRR